ncbi:MAG: glycosyltransferase [Deltaproteobacteria bacterium]|nr:MAG: glycosyltransferase [Deltaproteobacteria bacterium]
MLSYESRSIAVLLPCYDEEVTIGGVVRDFRQALPSADIYVFDNNSKDRTAEVAREAGAIVIPSPRQGKGFVVLHMFRVVEADIYIMADGDATYPADAAPKLIEILERNHADMVVGSRLSSHEGQSFRPLHVLGNLVFTGLVSLLFGVRLQDILSGYRVFSRRFVKCVPLSAGGFGIETDMTLNALSKGMTVIESPIHYGSRPEGSASKLSTFRDGFVILGAIFRLFKDYKPLAFFSLLASALVVAALAAGSLPIWEYLETGIVLRVPLAVLAASLAILAALMLSVGLILDTAARYHRETFVVLTSAQSTSSSPGRRPDRLKVGGQE